MLIDFNSISPESRVWIYQSDKKFTAAQKETIDKKLKEYCDVWAAHGQPLKASYDIRFDQVVILAADESFNSTSGCSVDDSVRTIKSIESETGLQFFNRDLIAFVKDDQLLLVELGALKEKYRTGIWNEDTLTLNNLVSTRDQLRSQWIVPAGSTWLKRYLPSETVKS
jgi:hypothetical protein